MIFTCTYSGAWISPDILGTVDIENISSPGLYCVLVYNTLLCTFRQVRVCCYFKCERTGCCISIPMIFVTDLNSLQYAKIGSTPDDALQAGLHTGPCLLDTTFFFEFGYGYLGESCGEKG